MVPNRSQGFRDLPVGAQRYLVATMVNMIGNGMLFAFLFIYLTRVRRFSSGWSGAILTSGSICALLFTSLGGWVVDHIGAKRALLISVGISVFVFGLYSYVTTVPLGFAVAIAAGVTQGLNSPAQASFASVIVESNLRPVTSSWIRVALNIGAGLGATVAGFLVKVDRPATFTVMFFLNVATFVVYFIIIATVDPVTAHQRTEQTGGYGPVFADRVYMRLLPIDLAAGVMFGLAFMVMPTTFLDRLGASERVVGLVVMSGTLVVIGTQLAVFRYTRGRSRLRTLAFMFGLFGAGFACGVAAVDQRLAIAIALVVAAQCVGALGEACLGPTRGPLTADLAPPQLLGRYSGLQTMLFQGGFGLSIGLGGLMLDVSFRGTWILGAAIATAAAVWAFRINHFIPEHARVSP
jgi:MFS family permease